jgi:hypothetical protein
MRNLYVRLFVHGKTKTTKRITAAWCCQEFYARFEWDLSYSLINLPVTKTKYGKIFTDLLKKIEL